MTFFRPIEPNRSDIRRAQNRERLRREAAKTGKQIERMHLNGDSCSLPQSVMDELRERVKPRGFRRGW